MRRKAKVDANQSEIVSALREVGASVAVTSALGKGFPDIVVGFRGINYLMEIKDGEKSPSRQKLTYDEQIWLSLWRGQVNVVNSVKAALDVLGLSLPSQP